jgi:hypothetical protein
VLQWIPSKRLEPGDVVVYGSQRRQICHVVQRPGWAWPVASDGTGWAIALGDALIEVQRTTTCAACESLGAPADRVVVD